MEGALHGQIKLENELADFINGIIENLEENIEIAVNSEIRQKDLIQYKGYIDVKGIFKNALDKFRGYFNTDEARKKIEEFVNILFRKGVEDIEKEFDVNLLGVSIQTNRIGDLTQTKTFKDSLLEDLNYINDKIVEKTRQTITSAVINGLNQLQINKKIREMFKSVYSYSDSLARTNAQTITEKGRYYAIQESGIEYRKYWSVHHDDRTCKICLGLGNKYDSENPIIADKQFKTIDGEWMTAPAHINCRCRTLYVRVKD